MARDNLSEFVQQLEAYRARRGLTQAQLAKQFSITTKAMNFWLLGQRKPSVEVIWRAIQASNDPEFIGMCMVGMQ